MVYIKGFDKPNLKNKPVGGLQLRNVLKGMKYSERAKLKQKVEDLGTGRIHLHDLADKIAKEHGKIIGQRFQQAAVKIYGEKEIGLTKKQIERNINLARHQRLSEEGDTYKSFAQKLKNRESGEDEASIERRKGAINKPPEATITSRKQPVAGFVSGKQGGSVSFARDKSPEANIPPVKPKENPIDIAPVR